MRNKLCRKLCFGLCFSTLFLLAGCGSESKDSSQPVDHSTTDSSIVSTDSTTDVSTEEASSSDSGSIDVQQNNQAVRQRAEKIGKAVEASLSDEIKQEIDRYRRQYVLEDDVIVLSTLAGHPFGELRQESNGDTVFNRSIRPLAEAVNVNLGSDTPEVGTYYAKDDPEESRVMDGWLVTVNKAGEVTVYGTDSTSRFSNAFPLYPEANEYYWIAAMNGNGIEEPAGGRDLVKDHEWTDDLNTLLTEWDVSEEAKAKRKTDVENAVMLGQTVETALQDHSVLEKVDGSVHGKYVTFTKNEAGRWDAYAPDNEHLSPIIDALKDKIPDFSYSSSNWNPDYWRIYMFTYVSFLTDGEDIVKVKVFAGNTKTETEHILYPYTDIFFEE